MLIELFAVLEMVEIEAAMEHMWEWFTCARRGPAPGDYQRITITGDTWSWWQHHYISWPPQVSHSQDSVNRRRGREIRRGVSFLNTLWLDKYLKNYATFQIFTEGTKNISEQKVLFSFHVLHILEFGPKYDDMKWSNTQHWIDKDYYQHYNGPTFHNFP